MAGPHAQAGGYAVRGAVGAVVVADAARVKRVGERRRVRDQSAIATLSHYFAINLNCLT